MRTYTHTHKRARVSIKYTKDKEAYYNINRFGCVFFTAFYYIRWRLAIFLFPFFHSRRISAAHLKCKHRRQPCSPYRTRIIRNCYSIHKSAYMYNACVCMCLVFIFYFAFWYVFGKITSHIKLNFALSNAQHFE